MHLVICSCMAMCAGHVPCNGWFCILGANDINITNIVHGTRVCKSSELSVSSHTFYKLKASIKTVHVQDIYCWWH